MNSYSLDEVLRNRNSQIDRLGFTLAPRKIYWDTKMQLAELDGNEVNRGVNNSLQIFAQQDLTPYQIKMIEAKLRLAATYEEMMQIMTDQNADHLIYPLES